ncbi:hypothetical protein P8625_12580 [Tenacibaculum tangerinum]|uniref:Lipocalin-like domain-containing protein n=1 Tax=Tenacibaculum tangerinum TaxID=3038772 RepID=A0ABY8L0B9_9FLAO|nr:hypothetical protein [Tenacibaculum tangerinum]WGH74904.1 hypothetical protein P8625_12580 [Tenacibaculum tangerinum]
MKLLKIPFFLLGIVLFLSSCRTEEIQIIDPPIENALVANTTVATLMKNTVAKDGSHDNIIDKASCLSVKLPVTVTVNSKEVTVNDENGYEEIENIFDLFDDDVDSIVISYPIEVILSDYTVKTVNSDEELAVLSQNCKGENEEDDDIECLDFNYPLTASVFNANYEVVLTITVNNDEEMHELIEDLEDYTAVTIDFPFKVILNGDTYIYINNMQELEEAIEAAKNTCDEDDDNDYNDDDCDDCTTNQLIDIFAQCEEWRIDKLEIGGQEFEDYYVGTTVYFRSNNTVKIIKNGDIFEGSWETSGEGNEIKVTINIPNFEKFNKTWYLHEISDYEGEVKVDLRLGDDRLRFESFCNNATTTGDDLSEVLTATNSEWYIEKYLDNTIDETTNFEGYTFLFQTSGIVKAISSTTTDAGMWKSLTSSSKFYLEFTSNEVLQELNDDQWEVISISASQVKLQALSNSGTETDTLIFVKK